MKKRTFIKLSSALTTGTLFSPLVDWQQGNKLKNWAGNLEYSTNRLVYADSVEQVQQLVKKYSKLKVLGSRHCFNDIADSTENLISLKQMNQVVDLDAKAGTVTIGGGMNYGQLSPYLHSKGFALHNLASLPHISVAGACATATHGSGIKNGNLATAVSAMEIVTAGGDMLTLSRKKNGEQFQGAVVGLGALGVVTKITLSIEPTFMMRQDVYENLPMQQVKDHFEEILSGGYSVSLFTDWQSRMFNEVWVKNRISEGTPFKVKPEFFEARLATKNLHPIADLSAENCTEQMGIPGPWYERLPHFRMGFTPSSGEELQSEYFIPRHNGVDALLAIDKLRDKLAPQLLISEIRAIDADNFWMSPCYKQPCIAIHFTWKQNWAAVSKLLPVIEQQLTPFGVRPHWGKLFAIPPSQLKALYEKMPDFQKLVKEYDPQGKFRNKFLNRNIFAS